MTKHLLWRGMLAGMLAGLLALAFARVFGEAQVQLSIDFEDMLSRAAGEAPEPELVSRAVQRGWGLLTACTVYGAGLGGLFALAFAAVLGRVRQSPRTLSALLALAGFMALVLVPQLKYPANPPAVGEPETIGLRTALYFEMLLVSAGAMTLAGLLGRWLMTRLDAWHAGMLAALAFVAVIAAVQWALPDINEVPAQFPAVVLWRFRVAAIGTQAVLWGGMGLGFGALAERLLNPVRQRALAWHGQ